MFSNRYTTNTCDLETFTLILASRWRTCQTILEHVGCVSDNKWVIIHKLPQTIPSLANSHLWSSNLDVYLDRAVISPVWLLWQSNTLRKSKWDVRYWSWNGWWNSPDFHLNEIQIVLFRKSLERTNVNNWKMMALFSSSKTRLSNSG